MFLLLALQVQQFFDIIEQHTDNIYVPGFGTYTVSWVVTMLEPVSLAKTVEDTQKGWAPAASSHSRQALWLLVGRVDPLGYSWSAGHLLPTLVAWAVAGVADGLDIFLKTHAQGWAVAIAANGRGKSFDTR